MTAALSHAVPAKFQLATADTWPDPWPMYRALRDHQPVHHVVPYDQPDRYYYVLSRHADIFAAARDHETFSSAQGLTVDYGTRADVDLSPLGTSRAPISPDAPDAAPAAPRRRNAAAGSGGLISVRPVTVNP